MPPPKSKRSDHIQYEIINDFRHGIVSNIRSGGSVGGVIDAPKPGMAQEGTVGCIANATGQLVPLPFGQSIGHVTCGSGGVTVFGNVNTCGIATAGPVTMPGHTVLYNDDVFILAQYTGVQSSVVHECFQSFVIKADGSVTSIQIFVGLATGATLRRGSTFAYTRSRLSNFNTPGHPIMAWEYTSGEPFIDGSLAQYVLYPNLTGASIDTPYGENYTVNNAGSVWGGQLLPHDGRIVRLAERSYDFGVNTIFETNELIRYTDPPNNYTLNTNTTDSILDPQIPGGYGSWGSISFGELLLVKRYGGAILVMGDLYAPQITRLEGMPGTGALLNKATACSGGLIYCVSNDGAYIWQGGSTAQKINNINDQFHTPLTTMAQGRRTDHCLWNNWVVFTNGWVYDPENSSWWQLENDLFTGAALRNIQWLAAGKGSTRYLWCVGGSGMADDNDPNIEYVRYDRFTPGTKYTWISQPLPVSTMRTIDVHEVQVSVSQYYPNTTITLQLQTLDGASATEHVTINPGGFAPAMYPTRIRLPIGVRGNSITMTLTVDSGLNPAPVTNAIIVGYTEAGEYGQN